MPNNYLALVAMETTDNPKNPSAAKPSLALRLAARVKGHLCGLGFISFLMSWLMALLSFQEKPLSISLHA